MQSIKRDAKRLYSENKYLEALTKLLEIDNIEEVINYIEKENKSKNNWFKDSKFAKDFFEVGLELIFDKILNEPELAESVFHYYFQFSSLFNEKLELALINSDSKLYVHLVRVNIALFNEKRLAFLENLDVNKEFSLHKKVWFDIQKDEAGMWNQVQNELNTLLKTTKFSLSEVLSYTVLWLEEKRWGKIGDSNYIHQLAKAYNLFICLLFNKSNDKWLSKERINEDVFEKTFLEIFSKVLKTKKVEKSNVIRLLEASFAWTNYRDNVIFPYCYNLQLFPEENVDGVYFNETPKGYYQWLLDDFRYENNQLSYLKKGTMIAKELVQHNNQILENGSYEEKELNFELLIRNIAFKETLESLGIEKAGIGDFENDAFELIKPFLGYAFNRNKRHEEKLLEFSHKNNFYDAYKLFHHKNQKYVDYPFIAMSKNEYLGLFDSTEKNETNTLFESFYDDLKKINVNFNRFNTLPYDVWLKPFIKIGDFLFSPMLFFANNNWFHAGVQALLKRSRNKEVERKETTEMELCLKKQFEKKKEWKVIRPDGVIGEQELEGDADLIVYDKETTLLIQLKRTYFRLDLKDAYYEDKMVNKKASTQLNKVEDSLKIENKTGFILENSPIKWIVTTSFERIGDEFNDCKKINYFDVLHALENEQLKTVKELVNYIEKDKFLQECITLFSIEDYRKCFIKKDVIIYYNEFSKYHSFLNYRNYLNALVSCKELLAKYPKDPQLMYEQSFIYWELKHYKEALWTYMDLYESYPKICKIKDAINDNLDKCINDKLLNKNELEIVFKRWNELTGE